MRPYRFAVRILLCLPLCTAVSGSLSAISLVLFWLIVFSSGLDVFESLAGPCSFHSRVHHQNHMAGFLLLFCL
jgi:hypothetical protein